MRFIQAFNSINSQVWAFLVLLTGCVSVVVFHKAGIDIGIAAGIIGVGANMFQVSMKQQPVQHAETDSAPDPTQPAPQPGRPQPK
jgi:hypothetical protein